MPSLVIFGIGEIAEVAAFYFGNDSAYEVAAFTVDAQFVKEAEFCGRPVVPLEEVANSFPPFQYDAFVGVGYSKLNALRRDKAELLRGLGYRLASYVSSRATLFSGFAAGDNCLILEDNTIQPFTRIGNNVTLWSGNHVGHHVTIGNNCFIASHVVISGGVTIGDSTFIGVNATLRDHIKIGQRCVIGAGAILMEDAPDEIGVRDKGNRARRDSKFATSFVLSAPMAWKRFGRIYVPDGARRWARSHAALPTPVLLQANRFRVLFSTRDEQQKSSVGWLDLDLSGPPQVTAVSPDPVLSPGPAGMYDDSGIGVGSVAAADDGDRLYYMGWNLGTTVPWRNSIGLATGSLRQPILERRFRGPILDRSPEDPFTLSYPWVLRTGGEWLMWYGSHTDWNHEKPYMHHVLKYARSRDGITWQRDAEPVLAGHPEEALARPTVVREGSGFRMWYAYRTSHYQIGCATSGDGRRWIRCDDEWGLTASHEDWESDMTSYPAAFSHRGRLWLLYNGNDYGRTGFGLAVWE